MSTRIDDLEKNIGELMNQAGVDEPEKWAREDEDKSYSDQTEDYRIIRTINTDRDTFVELFQSGTPVIQITSVNVTEFGNILTSYSCYNFCLNFLKPNVHCLI